VLRRAVELGVNHIDTAQFYGPDVSNELIREALYPYPEDLVLVSKVGARRDAQGAWLPAHLPDEMRSGVEDNLRSLGIERLGAVNLRLHRSDDPADDNPPLRLEDQLAEMVSLREEGKIAGVGISNATLDEVTTAVETSGAICVQNAFSLVDQGDIAVLDYCRDHAVAYVPYFPLGSGFPGMAKVTEDETVLAIASGMEVTPAQVGLAWLMAYRDNILLIPGTSSVRHLEENMQVTKISLSEDDLTELEKVGSSSLPYSR
jgi:aryl-alcohol dehydrogenase-like predicted oxidoreductase